MIPWVVNYRLHPRLARKSRAFSASLPLSHLLHLPHLLPSSPIFRIFFQVPYPATSLFATLTKTAGVCTNNSHSGTHRSRNLILATDFPPSTAELMSFLFISLRTPLRFFAPSCALPSLNSFIFKRFRTLRQKTKPSRQPLSALRPTLNPILSHGSPNAVHGPRVTTSVVGVRCRFVPRDTEHRACITVAPVAAFPAECYDLVFHDPC